MPKVLEGTARELILNIKKFCENEKKSKALLIPLKNVRARVAALAGVSEKTVSRIAKEGEIAATTSSRLVTPGKRRPHPKKIIVDQNDLNFIRQKIHHYYVANKEMPSVNKLRLELVTNINFKGSNTTLRRILKGIGFKFKSPAAKNCFSPEKPVKKERKKAAVKKDQPPLPAVSSTESFQDVNVTYQNISNISNAQNIYLRQPTFSTPTFTTLQVPSQMHHPVMNINMQSLQGMTNMQPITSDVQTL